MTDRIPAEVFPPGEFIREELHARRMTQNQFAALVDLTPEEVGLLVLGKYPVTEPLAAKIGTTFETSADLWLNLETAYRQGKNREART